MNAIKNYLLLNIEKLKTRELKFGERKKQEVNFEIEIQSSYQLWLSHLKDCIRKSCYRRVLGMISKMPIEFLDCYDYFEVEVLRLRCIIKIIVHKTDKYAQELRENRLKERKSIEFWINQLYFSLSHLILEIRFDIKENTTSQLPEEQKLNRLECTIYYFLYVLYILILYSEKINEIGQICAYLAMCSRFDAFISYCRRPKTLQVYIMISLFRARLFIQNADHSNALKAIENTMIICFRQCFLLVDFDEGLNDRVFEKSNNSSRKYDERIQFTCFIHMIVAFYQRSLCYEYRGNIAKSIEAYKQSSWICNKFIKASYPFLADVFTNLLKRSLCYHEVIKDILEYDTRVKDRLNKERLNRHLIEQNQSERQRRQKELLQKIANGDQTNHLKRLDLTAEQISKLEIKEIELNEKKDYPKSKYITSTLNLIDYLLNDSFRPIVKQMNTLELHCLDNDTMRKIEKQIIQTPNPRPLNKSNSCSLMSMNSNFASHYSRNNSNNSSSHRKKKKGIYIKRYPLQYKLNALECLNNNKHNKSIIIAPSTRYMPDSVERIKVDNTFNKDYRQKKKFLEKYNSKEIKFHKNLLRCKKNEINEKPNGVIPQFVRNSAESFIKMHLLSGKENDAKRILRNYDSQRDIQFIEKQTQLENQVLKSLSTKSYNEYQKNLISMKTLNTLKSQLTSLGYSFSDLPVKSNVNLDIIKKLEFDTQRLEWMKTQKEKKKTS